MHLNLDCMKRTLNLVQYLDLSGGVFLQWQQLGMELDLGWVPET